MNKTLIAEFEKASEAYPFRPFEVETIDGRRIRITKPFSVQKIYGNEEIRELGDIRIKNGISAFVRYAELKDVIYYLPWWKTPFERLWAHPELIVVAQLCILIGIVIGVQISSCTANSFRSATEQKGK